LATDREGSIWLRQSGPANGAAFLQSVIDWEIRGGGRFFAKIPI
jgi:hypothetical protein